MTAPDQPPPSLALVIVNYRTADYVIRCVESVREERARVGPFDLVVVDGNSGDGSAEKLSAHFAAEPYRDWVTVLPLDFNGGFGWANNQAMLRLLQRSDPPEFIHLLNPDTVLEPGAIRALLDVIRANPRIGAVGSQLFEPDGKPSGSAFRFPSAGREFIRGAGLPLLGTLFGIKPMLVDLSEPGPADWETGASVMFRSAALRQTGLFDDGFFLYFEEVELMYRLRLTGWAIWHVPASRVMHVSGAATGMASGVQIAVRPYPAYRYEARRRYFVRAHGLSGLVMANLAWLSGQLLGWPFRVVRGRHALDVPRATRMTLRYCFWPSPRDFRASFPQWNEPPGRRPAWSQP